jgi:hypothetical protein
MLPSETQQNISADNKTRNKSILSMQDLMILHANHIYRQSHKATKMILRHINTYKASTCKYTPFPNPCNKRHKRLSPLTSTTKNSKSSHWNTTHVITNPLINLTILSTQHSEDFDPGINDMFLNNLDPTCYAMQMQMQNQDVLTHAQMKRQVDTNKFVEEQRPMIDGLMDIITFEFIPRINLPPGTRYIDLIWTYRCKRRPDGSLKKCKHVSV